jgi:hypothetical protein
MPSKHQPLESLASLISVGRRASVEATKRASELEDHLISIQDAVDCGLHQTWPTSSLQSELLRTQTRVKDALAHLQAMELPILERCAMQALNALEKSMSE